MRVLWIHNFDVEKNPNAGVFMFSAYHDLTKRYPNYKLDLCYLGNLRNPFNILKAIFKIRSISEDYDIVHSQFGSMCAFICVFARSIRVLTIRGSDWYAKTEGSMLSRLHSLVQVALTRYSLNRFQKILVVSKRLKHEVVHYLASSITEVHVFPSPIDTEFFRPLSKPNARKQLGMSQDITYFLFPVVNRNNPVKRAWLVDEVSGKLPSHKVVLTACGIAHEDMCTLYNAVDAVLLPSIYEGWPNVIKEALSCNVPFIATDVSDLKEIAAKYPGCKIVEPNVDSLYEAIMSFQSYDINYREAVEWMRSDLLNDRLVKEIYSESIE